MHRAGTAVAFFRREPFAMNHSYRSLWNHALGAWVAAPETARAASAGSSSCVQAAATTPRLSRPSWRPTALALAAAAWLPGVAMAGVLVGPYITVSGDVSMGSTPITTPPPPPWNLGSSALFVGDNIFGQVGIADGATVTSGTVFLGMSNGSDGAVYVSGTGSGLTTQGLYVGYSGSGVLQILNGATVSSTSAQVSNSGSGSGIVSVIGSGSTWTNSGTLLLGVHGQGMLLIDGGGW